MRTLLLVFDPDPSHVDAPSKVLELGLSVQIYTFDDNVCFLKTDLEIDTIVDTLREKIFAGREFFVTEVNTGSQGGALVPRLWTFLSHDQQIPTAA